MASLCPLPLQALYREGRVLPFVGAGVSKSVRWLDGKGHERSAPLWTELVDEAAKQLGFVSPSLARVRGTDMQILEYFKLRHSEEAAPLTNWLAALSPDDNALRASKILSGLVNLTNCPTFYTTNYDDFLERALRLSGRSVGVIATESQMGVAVEGTEVVKFHGDLNHPSRIVLTESDYERRIRLESPMDHKFRADLLGRTPLFVGYSFKDPNVAYLFRRIQDGPQDGPRSAAEARAYIVVQDPSDFEFALFTARHMQVIPVRGAKIEEDIAQVLQELAE